MNLDFPFRSPWQRLGRVVSALRQADDPTPVVMISGHGAIADATAGHLHPLNYALGLAAAAQEGPLTELRHRMNDRGIEGSLFIAPDLREVEAAARIGSQFVELHTGAYAEHFAIEAERDRELDRLIAAARLPGHAPCTAAAASAPARRCRSAR